MTTKFDIGEAVHIRSVVESITIDENGKANYTLYVKSNYPLVCMPEEYLHKDEEEYDQGND